MRSGLVCLLLLSAGLAGCIGDDSQTTDPADGTDDPNLWQSGLASHYATPDHVETRSGEERRANLAPPGDPEFAEFDAEVEAWMDAHEIPTGTLAIMKDGELRYENGYGYVDREQAHEANASTMMRIASISKHVTKAVISLQVEQGLYNLTDPVFCLPHEDPLFDCRLPIAPHPDRPVVDERLREIQVGHLVNHTAGWAEVGPCNEATLSTAWPVQDVEVADAFEAADTLAVATPLEPWRVAQWMLGSSLTHEPGERYEYCNNGYLVLGLVAEAATGTSLEALLDAYLFEPLEIDGDIEPGRSVPTERNPREPFYACDPDFGMRQVPSVFDPNETVCWPDGGWSMRERLAYGGMIATPSAIVAIVETLPVFAGGFHVGLDTLENRGPDWRAGGSMAGTRAITAVVDGISDVHGTLQYAFIFNTRIPGDGTPWQGCDSTARDLWYEQYEEEPSGCEVDDLDESLVELLRAWGAADQARS